MKKILYICSEAASGMIPFAVNLIQTASRSQQLDVFALTVDDRRLSYRPYFDANGEKQIFSIQTSDSLIGRIFNKLYAREILRKTQMICREHHIDIIHLLTGDYTCCSIIPELKKMGTIYYTVHDFVPHETILRNWKERFFSRYMQYGQKRIMKQADCLVTCSHSQYELISKMYTDKNVYYHPFPSLITDSIINGRECCSELSDTEQYILFFGNIHLYKGVEYLYKAFQRAALSDYKLVIAGNGHIYFHCDNDDRILFINRYIRDGEIRQLFERAACVVYPYMSATQSGVLTLACHFGTPMIVSDISFFRENANNDICLFFKNADVDDLSAKLQLLLHEIDTQKMKAAQQAFYAQQYSCHNMTAAMETIYSSE